MFAFFPGWLLGPYMAPLDCNGKTQYVVILGGLLRGKTQYVAHLRGNLRGKTHYVVRLGIR